MTSDEQQAFDRGKHAAFRDARPHKLGTLARCEFRQPHLVKAWHAGYAEQVTASTKPLTPEQEANRQGMSDAITAWLAKTAAPVAGTRSINAPGAGQSVAVCAAQTFGSAKSSDENTAEGASQDGSS